METIRTDVLVLGSGIAGLSAAIRVAESGKVLVVTKGNLENSNTDMAQGGIAAAIKEEDSPFDHFQDSMSAGDYLCREEALRYLVEEGPACVRELIEWGARFDTVAGQLALTREGAHRVNRVLHARGDATGHEIHQTLIRKARALDHIQFMVQTVALDLIVQDGSCQGALCLDLESGRYVVIRSRATIIATGGSGQLYSRTTNTEMATGDGFAMAFRAGAVLEDMEFVQFHPTSFQHPEAPNFLLSEAMRGEGGILRNATMERFMLRYHTLADLAPRDVVSRAIYWEMEASGADHVYLDMTHFKKSFLAERFPMLFQRCQSYGLDISQQPIPVAPAAHYIMGGIKTDLDGHTSINGLYACGEVACTGVHGANRLASNSLLEGLVFGKRTGQFLLAHLGNSLAEKETAPDPRRNDSMSIRGEESYLERVHGQLCTLMWDNVGIIRTGASLNRAMDQIEDWLAEIRRIRSYPTHQLSGMLNTGLIIARAALERKGSRGGHFRADFPEKGDYGSLHVNIRLNPEGTPEAFWSE